MFTGIVEGLGHVVSMAGARLEVRSDLAERDIEIGDSVAVNGTCLTTVAVAAGVLRFDLSEETLARTGLSRLSAGDRVNLERPATLVSRLGGHLVQGHVDGIGDVTEVRPEPGGGARMRVRLPTDLLGFVVEKGSIAFDGVSLTVAAVRPDGIDVALIPHTLATTTLGLRHRGDRLNVEVDVMAKYVARRIDLTLERRASGQDDGDAATDAIERGRTAWTSA
jgi:riboflavin synthase